MLNVYHQDHEYNGRDRLTNVLNEVSAWTRTLESNAETMCALERSNKTRTWCGMIILELPVRVVFVHENGAGRRFVV